MDKNKNQKLFYMASQQNSLGDWADFFISFGRRLCSEISDKRRIVFSYILPSTKFSAGLISAGFISEKIMILTGRSKLLSNEQKINEIVELGKSFYYLDRADKKHKRAKFIEKKQVPIPFGKKIIYENFYIIQVQGESQTRGINIEKEIRNITLVPEDAELIDEGNVTGRIIESSKGGLVEFFLPSSHYLNVSSSLNITLSLPGLSSLIIGSKIEIQKEICDEQFYFFHENSDRFLEGHLQDMLRARQWMPRKANHSSEVHTDQTVKQIQLNEDYIPDLVIFQGSRAFLKNSNINYGKAHIILLDQTDKNLKESVEIINGRYSQPSCIRLDKETWPKPNCSLKMIGFAENCRA